MGIGVWQVILILVIVLIIFGAGKLPRVMGDVAKGIKNFKSGMKEEMSDEKKDEEEGPKVIEAEAHSESAAEEKDKSQASKG